MDALAFPEQLEISPLIWCGVQESGEPNEWEGDFESVGKQNNQFIVGDGHFTSFRSHLDPRRTHAMPPANQFPPGNTRRTRSVNRASLRTPSAHGSTFT